MARLNSRNMLRALAEHSIIPVINALGLSSVFSPYWKLCLHVLILCVDDYGHPCQILADLLTLKEHLGDLSGRKIAFVGDCRNNVTYDLCRAAAIGGFDIAVGSPLDKDFELEPGILEVNSLRSERPTALDSSVIWLKRFSQLLVCGSAAAF